MNTPGVLRAARVSTTPFLSTATSRCSSPYVYAAYDYQKYDGVYLEAGVKHDFAVPDTGVVLTRPRRRRVRRGHQAAFFLLHTGKHTGFQHYDLGLDLARTR